MDEIGDQTERFNDRYRVISEPAMLRVEKRVIGTDYGASSYTTRDQVRDLAARMRLGPGSLLLDIGTGAGWPGIHLARSTGCDVVLTDKPIEGLRVALRRMHEEGVAGGVVAAAGESLPFRDGTFDAVTSSDVLC
jgi:ubiquinone/menaquinone biosynthesis C-methylase UbiE